MSELNLALTFDAKKAEAIRAELSEHLQVSEPRSIILQSADPPSFLQLLGDASAWLPLKAAAAVYLSTLAKRAGDATWNRLETLFHSNEVKPLGSVAKTLATAADSLGGSEVTVIVGLNIPDDIYGTVISIKPGDPEEVARVLASFIVHAEQISKAMRAEIESNRTPLGRAIIELQDDGSLLVSWVAQADSSRHDLRIQSA